MSRKVKKICYLSSRKALNYNKSKLCYREGRALKRLPGLPWRWCPRWRAQTRFPGWTEGHVEADPNWRQNNGPPTKGAPAHTLLLQYSPPANTNAQPRKVYFMQPDISVQGLHRHTLIMVPKLAEGLHEDWTPKCSIYKQLILSICCPASWVTETAKLKN